MALTWREFKQTVDKYLNDNGISEDVGIDWIDTAIDHPVEVGYDPEQNTIAIFEGDVK